MHALKSNLYLSFEAEEAIMFFIIKTPYDRWKNVVRPRMSSSTCTTINVCVSLSARTMIKRFISNGIGNDAETWLCSQQLLGNQHQHQHLFTLLYTSAIIIGNLNIVV